MVARTGGRTSGRASVPSQVRDTASSTTNIAGETAGHRRGTLTLKPVLRPATRIPSTTLPLPEAGRQALSRSARSAPATPSRTHALAVSRAASPPSCCVHERGQVLDVADEQPAVGERLPGKSPGDFAMPLIPEMSPAVAPAISSRSKRQVRWAARLQPRAGSAGSVALAVPRISGRPREAHEGQRHAGQRPGTG
jgi:hypothetical protein